MITAELAALLPSVLDKAFRGRAVSCPNGVNGCMEEVDTLKRFPFL